MKNEEILKQAIEKALNNGWKKKNITFNPKVGAYEMIFSHDFAKAFWGEEEIDNIFIGSKTKVLGKGIPLTSCKYIWQYHLQQLVLEKEPTEYLRKFLLTL